MAKTGWIEDFHGFVTNEGSEGFIKGVELNQEGYIE